jgi:hypothetical protein
MRIETSSPVCATALRLRLCSTAARVELSLLGQSSRDRQTMIDPLIAQAEVAAIADRLSCVLPSRVYAVLRRYLDAGESDLAFEELCEVLSREHIALSADVYSAIKAIGEGMGCDSVFWEILADQVHR